MNPRRITVNRAGSLLLGLVFASACGAGEAAERFGPILGTARQGIVEAAVDRLSDTDDYRALLVERRVFGAICAILSLAEAQYVERMHEMTVAAAAASTPMEQGMTPELATAFARLNTHSSRSWAHWRSVAGVASLVETGALADYPDPDLERLAGEMRLAFEPLLERLDDGSVYGPSPRRADD